MAPARESVFPVARIRTGFTLVELLVVITIIGILIALLLPAIQAAREASRRTQCQNNLKQLSLAMLGFEQVNHHLPSGGWGAGWVGDPDRGTGLDQPGGWIYSILPQLEQFPLYQLGSDGDKDHWSAVQTAGCARRLQTPLPMLNCPTRRTATAYTFFLSAEVNFSGSDPVTQCARSDYAACAGDQYQAEIVGGFQMYPTDLPTAVLWTRNNWWPQLAVQNDSPPYNVATPATGICYFHALVTLAMITDGLSNTYLLGEKYLDPHNYFNGQDLGDCTSAFSGYNLDLYRTTYVEPMWPMQDEPGWYAPDFSAVRTRTTLQCRSAMGLSIRSIIRSTGRRIAGWGTAWTA